MKARALRRRREGEIREEEKKKKEERKKRRRRKARYGIYLCMKLMFETCLEVWNFCLETICVGIMYGNLSLSRLCRKNPIEVLLVGIR